jgi:hypothetical protein
MALDCRAAKRQFAITERPERGIMGVKTSPTPVECKMNKHDKS